MLIYLFLFLFTIIFKLNESQFECRYSLIYGILIGTRSNSVDICWTTLVRYFIKLLVYELQLLILISEISGVYWYRRDLPASASYQLPWHLSLSLSRDQSDTPILNAMCTQEQLITLPLKIACGGVRTWRITYNNRLLKCDSKSTVNVNYSI